MTRLFVFLCYFCLLAVVGGDEVSVMEGESVILQTHLQRERDEPIAWRFTDVLIAKMSTDIPTYHESGHFTNRLKLDHQTGSLTITNTRSTDTGVYTFMTITKGILLTKTFNVAVYAHLPVPDIIRDSSQCSSSSSQSKCLVVCSVVNVSAVSLSWYKGNSLLSSISVFDLSSSVSLPLEVEYQENNTYSCVINNTISNQTTYLDISTLCQPGSGVSGTDILKNVSVMEGESVTLHSDVTELQRNDEIQWRFGAERALIALKDGDDILLKTGSDGTFGSRLKLNSQTGSLTINNIRKTHSGTYELIIRRGGIVQVKKFSLTLFCVSGTDTVKKMSVMEGESVTLHSDVTEVQRNDDVRWTFGAEGALIALKDGNDILLMDGPDGRFRGRLHLDPQTGSLTINNTTKTDSGPYQLTIRRGEINQVKKFSLTVF